MSELPAQPSLRRLKAFGIRPVRDLGQNFLIDSNLLGVIARAAELGPDDVVLEVGGGLGVLSEYLAERAAHVHVVEVDRRLEPALRDATDPHANVTLHFADAVKLDLAALDARSHEGDREPALRRRRVGDPAHDRAAAVGRHLGRDGPARGRRALRGGAGERRLRRARRCSPSSRARCACCAPSRAACSTRCRTSTPCSWACAVAARRPSRGCARSCSRASRTGARRCRARCRWRPARAPEVRDAARAALEGARAPARRARRGARAGGVAGAVRGDARVTVLRARAPGKVNLCLFVGEPREDGLHPLVSVVQALSLADELTLEPGGDEDEVVCAGRRGAEPRGPRARALPRGDGLGRAAAAADDREADPGRGRDGRGLLGRRRDAAARRPRRGPPRAARARAAAGRRRREPPAPRARADDRRRRARRAARPAASARRARAAGRRGALDARGLRRGRPPRAHAQPRRAGAARRARAGGDVGARQRPAGRGAVAVPAHRHGARRRARRGRRPRARLRLRPDRRRALRRRGRAGPRRRGGERVRLAARAGGRAGGRGLGGACAADASVPARRRDRPRDLPRRPLPPARPHDARVRRPGGRRASRCGASGSSSRRTSRR